MSKHSIWDLTTISVTKQSGNHDKRETSNRANIATVEDGPNEASFNGEDRAGEGGRVGDGAK